MGWCMENCKCHSHLHRHCWTSEIKKSEEKALHVGFTNSPPQAVVVAGDAGLRVRLGASRGTGQDVCSCFMCAIPKGLGIFTTVCLKPTQGTLHLAFASH